MHEPLQTLCSIFAISGVSKWISVILEEIPHEIQEQSFSINEWIGII
jgi:hypothetical protein